MDLSSLKPMLAVVAMELWKEVLKPELEKLDGSIKSEDLKIVADAMLAAIEKLAEKELPKLGA